MINIWLISIGKWKSVQLNGIFPLIHDQIKPQIFLCSFRWQECPWRRIHSLFGLKQGTKKYYFVAKGNEVVFRIHIVWKTTNDRLLFNRFPKAKFFRLLNQLPKWKLFNGSSLPKFDLCSSMPILPFLKFFKKIKKRRETNKDVIISFFWLSWPGKH